jgi:3-oxoacyl-[acyl-carrier protein] reductase
VLEEAVAAKGAYWGWVVNAGVARDNAFPALSDEDWDEVIDTSLHGFYNVTHPLVMPLVRMKKGGRIVVMTSVSGVIGNRGQVNYSAAKAGLIGAAKALAVELGSRAITVNCVAPGLIDTEMIKALPLSEALKVVPLNRLGKPEEVAAAVAFLMSPGAAYITRQVIGVNGGLV